MEAIERYCGIFQGDEIRIARSFADFAPGEAIPPNDVRLFSEAQFDETQAAQSACGEGGERPRRFDRSTAIEWTPVWSLCDERFKYLPTSLLYYSYDRPGADPIHADSNGCAAGNTLEEAIVQGFLELVERDAYAIWWYNRLYCAEIDIERLGDPYISDVRMLFAERGRRLWLLDITSDLSIAAVIAVAHWTEGDQEHLETGSGAHFDLRIAALRAVTELNQCLSIGQMTGRGTDASDAGSQPLPLRDHDYLVPHGKPVARPDFAAEFGSLDPGRQVTACVELVRRLGHDFLVLDQTRPDIEAPVARVIVPGLRHFYRRFAPGRLYDVPLRLGRRKRPSVGIRAQSAASQYLKVGFVARRGNKSRATNCSGYSRHQTE